MRSLPHDLRIAADDLVFGADGEPETISGLEVVAQDLRHRLRTSGRVADLVAEDGDNAPALAAIAFEVEEDARIKPGTARVFVEPNGTLRVTARTLEGGDLSATLQIQGGSP